MNGSIDFFKMFMNVLGGLGMFLFGMTMLSQALQGMGSNYVKKTINYITRNRVMAVLVGTLLTAFVQSSSVSTVMVSGFMNAGLMTLEQGIAFVFGANIGTTITGWIISLNVGIYGLLLVGVGALFTLFSRRQWLRNAARIVLALGFIFYGLQWMSEGFKPLRTCEEFISVMEAFDAKTWWSILACIGIGCLLTMVIQSSSAMLAITITLAQQDAIGFTTAAALVLGENIGTTITLWLASLSGGRITKQIALAHTTFNMTGTLIVFCIFPYYLQFVEFIMHLNGAGAPCPANVGPYIAAVHTVFNIALTLIFTPLLKLLLHFVQWAIPLQKEINVEKLKFFNRNLYKSSPLLVVQQARLVLYHLFTLTRESLEDVRDCLLSREVNPDRAARIVQIEEEADEIQKEIVLFLSNATQFAGNPKLTKEVQSIIHAADELESVTDYCANIAKYKKRLEENGMPLTDTSRETMRGFLSQTVSFFNNAESWLEHPQDIDMTAVMNDYSRLGTLADSIRDEHLQMVQDQTYPPLFTLTFSDIMMAIRRIKNHTLNLAETQQSDEMKV